jgi:hypothetical protein
MTLFERAARSEVALEVLRSRLVREGNHSLGEPAKRRRLPWILLHAATIA